MGHVDGDDVDIDRHAVAQERNGSVERDRRDNLAGGVRRVVALLRDGSDHCDVPGQLRRAEVFARDDRGLRGTDVRHVLLVDASANDEAAFRRQDDHRLSHGDRVPGLQRAQGVGGLVGDRLHDARERCDDAHPAHLCRGVLPVVVALRRIGARCLHVAALVLRGVGARGGELRLRLVQRVAIGSYAVGQHRRLARQGRVDLAELALRLLIRHLGLRELRERLVERVPGDRLLREKIAVGVGDALRLAQIRLCGCDARFGRRALSRRRLAAVPQSGLRAGAFVLDRLVEREPRVLHRRFGLDDRRTVLRRQRTVG